MPAKIVVLGSGGRLGAALERTWRQNLGARATVFGVPKSALDLADPVAVEGFVNTLSEGDWVVNAAGLTSLEACEANPQLAWQVNADAVGRLCRGCQSAGARFLHFSTDYVFSGEAERPYTEAAACEPLSVYGASKFAGEQQVLAAGAEHVVARVSWVFGPDRPAFPDFMLNRAMAGEPLAAVADKWASPTYTLDVAEWLEPFISGARLIPGGIYHLCNSGFCTWRDYAQATVDIAVELGVLPHPAEVGPLPMTAMTTWTGRRPVFTPLATEKMTQLIGSAPRPWQEALRDYLVKLQ
jgi:dTDP-4-dehydrorhamnose reductase